MRRLQKAGDIDIIPAGVDGSWNDDAECTILRIGLQPSLLNHVAEDLGKYRETFQLVPRFQVRDTRIEGIAWAIKADLEATTPSDALYVESLANALAVRLIETAREFSSVAVASRTPKFSARQSRVLTDFIETNLDRKLHLSELAGVVGVSATRLKTLFRNSFGVPVHQYVIRRRIEHARALITTTLMSLSEVAASAGFAHQSHMTTTMRRLLGQTPGEIIRAGRN